MEQQNLTMLLIAILISSSILASVQLGFSSDADWCIDAFTQKTPFDGRGLNVSSDAFSPGETVILQALVTYKKKPQEGLLVTFSVWGADNSTFSFADLTDVDGIASVNFVIPQKCPPNENETFGEWVATASVRVDDRVFRDTLNFKVGWIVEVLSVETINENFEPHDSFGITGDVGFEIALKNIAMTEKNATLSVVLQDELSFIVDFLKIDDFEVPPNEKTVFLYGKLNIPRYAHVGKARIFVTALTKLPSEGGVAYCPTVSAVFSITRFEPLKLDFYDVAIVKVTVSATSVKAGELVCINVKVRNEGTVSGSFNVSVCVNGTIVQTLDVLNLAPYSFTTLSFELNTSKLVPGNYEVSAVIPHALYEFDVMDNIFMDGYLEVLSETKRFLVTFKQKGIYSYVQGIVLTVNGSAKTITDMPYSFWVEEGDVLTYSYTEIVSSIVSGKRFKLDSINGSYSPVFVSGNITIIGNYKTQYYLTVTSAYGVVSGEGWYDANASVYAFLNINVLDHGNGTRRVFTFWSGAASGTNYAQCSLIVMNEPKTVVANWKTQYRLTVNTYPAELKQRPTRSPSGEADAANSWWYDKNVNVSLSAPLVEGYDFNYWEVDGIERTSSFRQVTIHMDAPHTAKAYYSLHIAGWFIPDWFYWILLLILVLIMILLGVFAHHKIKRKSRTEKEAFYRGWTAWYYGYDLRGKTRKS